MNYTKPDYKTYLKQQYILHHLQNKINLCEEISMMNSFWKNYITVSVFLYSSMYSFAMYIVLLSVTIMEAKMFFGLISIQPLFIVITLVLSSASIYDPIYTCHKYYYSMMAPKPNQFRLVNLRSQFKVNLSFVMIVDSKKILILIFKYFFFPQSSPWPDFIHTGRNQQRKDRFYIEQWNSHH